MLGKFQAFVAGDWIGGLTLLQQGEDASLKQLARLDLADSADPHEQLALAQKWQAMAGNVTEIERASIEHRARMLYRMARSDLDGSDRVAAENGLSELRLPPSQVMFRMKLDGCSQLVIDSNRMSWIQFYGQAPEELLVNARRWDLSRESEFENQGRHRFFPDEADLQFPHIKKIHGRGLVLIHRTPQPSTVVIDLNDVPPGEDDYEFALTFGSAREQGSDSWTSKIGND